jgi:hypothetical protein
VADGAVYVTRLSVETHVIAWQLIDNMEALAEIFAMIRVCEFAVLVPLLGAASKLRPVNSK